MRIFKYILLFALVAVSFSCFEDEDDKVSLKDQESLKLSTKLLEIENLASSKSCDDSSEWTFVSYGSKACGGPIGYIAYPNTIDVIMFLEKVEAHRKAQNEYNMKWNIASDCSFALEPNGVECVDGKPVFIYESID